MSIELFWLTVNFVKFGAVKNQILLQGLIKFLFELSQFIVGFRRIWYKISNYNSAQYFWVLWKLTRKMACFPFRSQISHIFACTVTLCYAVNAQNLSEFLFTAWRSAAFAVLYRRDGLCPVRCANWIFKGNSASSNAILQRNASSVTHVM